MHPPNPLAFGLIYIRKHREVRSSRARLGVLLLGPRYFLFVSPDIPETHSTFLSQDISVPAPVLNNELSFLDRLEDTILAYFALRRAKDFVLLHRVYVETGGDTHSRSMEAGQVHSCEAAHRSEGSCRGVAHRKLANIAFADIEFAGCAWVLAAGGDVVLQMVTLCCKYWGLVQMDGKERPGMLAAKAGASC